MKNDVGMTVDKVGALAIGLETDDIGTSVNTGVLEWINIILLIGLKGNVLYRLTLAWSGFCFLKSVYSFQ